MSAVTTPTFDSVALFTKAVRSIPGSIQTRVFFETMPGLDGMYAQTHGKGAQDHRLTGILEGTSNASLATAYANWRTALQTIQAKADGNTVGDFLDLNNATVSNCILLRYEQVGGVQTRISSDKYICYARCVAVVRELNP